MLQVLQCLRKNFTRRTLLEQFLIIFSLMLFISFLSILLVLIARSGVKGNEKESITCGTKCVKQANYILEKLDPSVGACEDFYEFACGGYKRHHTLAGGKRSHQVEDDVESEIYGIIRNILTSTGYHRSRSYKNAKQFYKCCMEGTDEFDGTSDLIRQILKTSDILWSSALSDREWKKAVVNMILYDSFPFYYLFLNVGEDKVTATISKAKPGTRRTLLSEQAFKYFTGEYRQIQKDYLDLIDSTMILTGKALMGDRDEQNCTYLHEIATKLFKAERKLAVEEIRCSRAKSSMSIGLYSSNTHSCSGMNDQTEWVAAFVDQVVMNGRYAKLDVECDCANYVITIEEVLKTNKTFRYYALWRHLARYLPLVSSSFRHSYMRLYQALNPLDKELAIGRGIRYFKEKWKQCVHLANEAYGLTIAQIYKKEGYHEEDEEEIFELADNILKTFGEMFASQSFMDNETIYAYLNKLEDLTLDVNYPEIILEDFKLEDYYLEESGPQHYRCNPVRQVEHPKSCFVYSLLKNECIKMKNDLLSLGYEKLNGSSFVHIPPISSRVNVDLERGILTIPAGTLRFPYYSPRFYKFAKYGGVAAHVIRELSRKMRAELRAEAKPVDLIEKSGKECLMHQYADSLKGDKDSQRNLEKNWEEIIIDNVAVRVAFELYKRDFETEADEPKLPSLEYNSDQLFFIKYAQMYCEIRNNTFSVFDTSIPAKFRVNNAMMNSEVFSEVFECPEESPMSPSNKCHIWHGNS